MSSKSSLDALYTSYKKDKDHILAGQADAEILFVEKYKDLLELLFWFKSLYLLISSFFVVDLDLETTLIKDYFHRNGIPSFLIFFFRVFWFIFCLKKKLVNHALGPLDRLCHLFTFLSKKVKSEGQKSSVKKAKKKRAKSNKKKAMKDKVIVLQSKIGKLSKRKDLEASVKKEKVRQLDVKSSKLVVRIAKAESSGSEKNYKKRRGNSYKSRLEKRRENRGLLQLLREYFWSKDYKAIDLSGLDTYHDGNYGQFTWKSRDRPFEKVSLDSICVEFFDKMSRDLFREKWDYLRGKWGLSLKN